MRRLTAAALLTSLLAAGAFAAPARDNARDLLKKGDFAGAAVKYSSLAKGSQDAALVAEYGYALALAGFADFSLAQVDRALQLDATNDEVLFHASKVLAAAGLADAAQEISRPAPGWLGGPGPEIAKLDRPETGAFKEELRSAANLMGQRRFASAVERFSRITRKHPGERLGWSGYAIVLEKIGAYQAAGRAVGRDIELSKQAEEETQALMAEHKQELESRPKLVRVPPQKANDYLKGRYLSFFGGNLVRTPDETVINLNGRVGKFLTNRVDAGVSAGLVTGHDDSDYNGLSLGVFGRYHKPLPVSFPLNATAGARLEYVPAPSDNSSLTLSPGLSYFLKGGSVDLILDFAVSGPFKGTKTLSVGYSVYFGGGR